MDFAAQVKASVDIVSVVGEYVRLKRVGATPSYTGLCPFHTEKTPSFRVHGQHQFYKCFGCGQGGDVFKFVMEIERLSFYEALKILAERQGIPMPKRSQYSDAETKVRASILDAHEIAADAFRASLRGPSGAEARAYLERRGVAPEQIEQFGLGYAERGGNALLRLLESRGLDHDMLEQSGLVLKRNDGSGFYDRFRNRLMFPIHNESGKIIAFGGRALGDDEPKYLNSPETPIYKKSFVLYNLHRAKDAMRKQERSLLVEGYMDVIGVYAAGVREVVASCGTALTNHQVQSLKRHADRVVVNFDPDAAGANAAERSIQLLLDEGLHIRVLELDGGLDPDEYCKDRGADGYRAALDGAKGYFYWLADRARSRFDMHTAEGRVAAFQFLLPAIQRVPTSIERAAVASDVAEYLKVPPDVVLDNFRKAATERRERTMTAPAEQLRHDERMLLRLLLTSHEARHRLLPELKSLGVTEGLTTGRILDALLALHESGAPFEFSALDARLEEADRSRLAGVALAGETDAASPSLSEGEACVESLRTQTKKTRIAEIQAKVKEAERSGDLAEALRLAEELNRLKKTAAPAVVQ